MGTDSDHRSARTGAGWLGRIAAAITAVAAIVTVIASFVLAELSLAWTIPIVAGLAAAVAYFVVRTVVSPSLLRAESTLVRIEELVSPEDVPVEASNGAPEDLGLVDRLELSVGGIESRIARLKRIENYRQEFLGDVSHELQTPIYAVQGFAETLLDGALEDPAVNRPFVEKILRHSERLSALVNDLSHISQIETGSLKMRIEPFDPGSLVNDSEEALEVTAEQSGVALYKYVAPEVEFALGDRIRIRQVLDNLISNGIKYNDPGGRVEVTVRPLNPDKVLFSVTDDGIGLSEEHFLRVTERFFRVDKSRSRDRGGTGLGLAIAKHILEAHGSALQINSRVGHGSSFRFELDAADRPDSTGDHE